MGSKARSLGLVFMVTFVAVIFSGKFAFAVGNLRVGLLEIHPELTLAGGLDDNVFLEHDDEKDDNYWVVTPGINLALENKEHFFGLGYKVDIIRYNEYSSQDSENHTAFGKVRLNFPGALFIKLDNVFQDTSDYATSEFVDRVKRQQNKANASIGLEFSDNFVFQLDYGSVYHKYNPNEYLDTLDLDSAAEERMTKTFEALDRFEHEFGPAIYIKFLPKTSVLVEYHYGIINYFDVDEDVENDNSSTFQQVMGGLKWEATAKSTGILKAGYQWKDYDEEKNLDGSKKSDKETWVVSGEINVEFTPKTVANLLVKRSIVESSFTNNDYYVENHAAIKINQKMAEKLAVNLGFGYYENRYQRKTVDADSGEEIKRKDDIFDGSIGMEYQIQDWLMVGVNFVHQTRDSNSSLHDYKDNKGIAFLNVAF